MECRNRFSTAAATLVCPTGIVPPHSSPPTRRRSLQRFLIAVAVALLAPAEHVESLTPSSSSNVHGIEIEEKLLRQVQEEPTSSYAIFFRNKADLSPAHEMDWVDRGRFVVRELQAVAEASQGRVREHLTQSGAEFKGFWIDNVIVVEQSDLATFNSLLQFEEIAALRADPGMQLIEPEGTSEAGAHSFAVESNIEHVKAPEVWALGFEGQGMVVGSIDTGVRYTHEALVSQYRGNLDGSFDHNHNWWDPGAGIQLPVDLNGHGSHTTGIMVGDDGDANQIGMAPGAQWIACRGCPTSSCPGVDLLECAEFMAAPWDLNGENADPDLRPHVVNNSWGNCEQFYNPWFQGAVDAWHAAGIVPISSNGNASNCGYPSPPGCNTVGNPARYANVLGVGSTGKDNGEYASHSNWGPTDDPWDENALGFPTVKPNVMAPGVAIRSSFNSGNDDYLSASGTSMSAPHAAGLVALLWQAAPCLVGDYLRTAEILMAQSTEIPFDSQCGGEGPNDVPNHATGWGEIDALAIVEAGIVACSVTGPALDLIPSPLDFGTVPVSQSADPRSLTLRNVGTEILTISGVSDLEAPFTTAGGTCPMPPFTLAPLESCTLTYTFSPTALGSAESTVSVLSDAASGPDAVSLQGTGTEFLRFVPSSLVFGVLEVGTTAPPLTATLQNIGTIDATALGFSLPSSTFQANSGACGNTLAAGQSCSIDVTFVPVESGGTQATLTVTSEQHGASASVNLAGDGVAEGEPRTILASRASGVYGVKGNVYSNSPSVSANGRYVAFMSRGTNLHPSDTDSTYDVLVRDLQTHETMLASRASGADGVKGNGTSWFPSLSADGRVVAFESRATNLVPEPTLATYQVYVRDLQTHETIVASRASGADGTTADEFAHMPSISADGRFVAFQSFATNLHPDDATENNNDDVYVRDLQTDETILVSRANGADGVTSNDRSAYASISADGRFVAFASLATNLHPDDTDGIVDVYVRDLQTEGTILVSRASGADGVKGNGSSGHFGGPAVAISDDGRFVAFPSKATNLHPDKTDNLWDVFIRDLQTHETILVSRASGASGVKGNDSSEPRSESISADGRYVAFHSFARNIHPHKADTQNDVFVRDLETHETILVSRASGWDGVKGDITSVGPSISADGRFIAFGSVATNLHPHDTDDTTDIFVRDFAGAPAEQAVLTFDPSGLKFGDIETGTTSPHQTVMLHNTGAAAASGIVFSLPDEGFNADTSGCGASLPSSGSCDVVVTFTPAVPGSVTEILEVNSNEGATADLGLNGNGVAVGTDFIPTSLAVDVSPVLSDGNGVLEPGELVETIPAWRNENDTSQSLFGTASNLTGLHGAVYTLALDDTDYGSVDPGQTASCLDTGVCYRMGVNAPTARPMTHWDATFEETLSDDTARTWDLHIGDSFLDVPRSNSFYVGIETLLHSGVTGGCTATKYCPADTNTRGQMAIFLLKAAEGGDYAPPACEAGEERFADVPFDSVLCPWIEELAARQVTSGCGGGDYCPGDPVTRAQMAVFLLKASEDGGYTPPGCTGGFSDVPCTSAFAAWVEELSDRGITSGCNADPPAYCPADPVTRAQMAVFVTKTFELALYGP